MPRKTQAEDKAEDRLIWPPPHAHQLLILLEDFVQKTHGAILNIKDFKVMAVKLLGSCAKLYRPAQVKSKYHRMRIIYGKFKKLINHTGFGWDFDNNTPMCDTNVWDDYCKANPGVSKFKYVGLSNYEMHKNVFEKSNATGGLGYSSANPPCDVDDEANIEDRFLHPDNGRSDDDDEAFQDYIGGQHSGYKRAGPLSGRGRGRKKRTTDADYVSAAIMEVASALKSRADVSMASQRLHSKTVNNEEEFTLAACQKIVDSMGVTPTAYLKAMQYLMANKEWRGVFGRISDDIRWSWIASLDC
ncbi:hypothetical protein UlMin_008018 [Ulmus minor]